MQGHVGCSNPPKQKLDARVATRTFLRAVEQQHGVTEPLQLARAGENTPPTALVVNCAVGGLAFELTQSFSLVLGVDSRPELLAAARVGCEAPPDDDPFVLVLVRVGSLLSQMTASSRIAHPTDCRAVGPKPPNL